MAGAGTPRTGRYLQREREGHDGDRHDDGQRSNREARRAERRREAEKAVRHQQEQGDEGFAHVLAGDQPGSILRVRDSPPRMANESATQPAPWIRWRTHCNVVRAARSTNSTREPFDSPGSMRHRPIAAFAVSSRSPRPTAVPSPGLPDPEPAGDSTPRRYSARDISHSFRLGRTRLQEGSAGLPRHRSDAEAVPESFTAGQVEPPCPHSLSQEYAHACRRVHRSELNFTVAATLSAPGRAHPSRQKHGLGTVGRGEGGA